MTRPSDQLGQRAGRLAALVAIGVLTVSACTFGAPRFAGYDLPPEERRYTLTLDYENTHTRWKFWSSHVSRDETPEGIVCSEQIHAAWMGNEIPPPCRPEPLIFLRYDARVDLTNSVAALGHHRMTVHAYRQADDGPSIMGLRLWTSIDDGATWRPARVIPHGRGREGTRKFHTVVAYPALSNTTGAVSIRAEAWDVDGNRVKQRIDRAFALTSR